MRFPVKQKTHTIVPRRRHILLLALFWSTSPVTSWLSNRELTQLDTMAFSDHRPSLSKGSRNPLFPGFLNIWISVFLLYPEPFREGVPPSLLKVRYSSIYTLSMTRLFKRMWHYVVSEHWWRPNLQFSSRPMYIIQTHKPKETSSHEQARGASREGDLNTCLCRPSPFTNLFSWVATPLTQTPNS